MYWCVGFHLPTSTAVKRFPPPLISGRLVSRVTASSMPEGVGSRVILGRASARHSPPVDAALSHVG